MTLKEIKKMAGKMSVKIKGISQDDIILAIQEAEGNIPCYKTEKKYDCQETNCLWEEDCKMNLS